MSDEQRIRERLDEAIAVETRTFDDFFLLRFFGMRVTYDDTNEVCSIAVPFGPAVLNPQGTMHGGIITMAADISMANLCHRYLGMFVTLEMSVRFLTPARGSVRCEGRFIRKGRNVVNAESRVLDEEGRLCALVVGTWFRSQTGPPDVARDLPGRGE